MFQYQKLSVLDAVGAMKLWETEFTGSVFTGRPTCTEKPPECAVVLTLVKPVEVQPASAPFSKPPLTIAAPDPPEPVAMTKLAVAPPPATTSTVARLGVAMNPERLRQTA